MPPALWQTRLSQAAQRDLRDLTIWTARTFGERQSISYARIVLRRITAPSAGPGLVGVKPLAVWSRSGLASDVFVLRVAASRNAARHVIYFSVSGERRILVLRILHDGMDPALHLPSDDP